VYFLKPATEMPRKAEAPAFLFACGWGGGNRQQTERTKNLSHPSMEGDYKKMKLVTKNQSEWRGTRKGGGGWGLSRKLKKGKDPVQAKGEKNWYTSVCNSGEMFRAQKTLGKMERESGERRGGALRKIIILRRDQNAVVTEVVTRNF